jgi:hypothetical protein
MDSLSIRNVTTGCDRDDIRETNPKILPDDFVNLDRGIITILIR